MIDVGWPAWRANAADIASYLEVEATALSILKVINHAPGKNWSINVTFDSASRLCLTIQTPEVAPLDLLDGTCPELFWCHEIIVADEVKLLRSMDPPSNTEVESSPNDGTWAVGITLVEYQNARRLDPDFYNTDKLHQFLRDETWLGSKFYAKSTARLSINVLAQHIEISPADLLPSFEPPNHFSREITIGPRRIGIEFPANRKAPTVRIDRLGILHDVEPIAPIIGALRCDVLKTFEVELQGDWPYEVGPLGAPFQTERIGEYVDGFVDKIKSDSKLNELVEKLRLDETKRQAAHLNARLAEAKASPLVYWGDKLVGCVPTSEQGTVAVIHKLEGMGALPLARYDSLAWAGHEGIDAIVDLQFATDEPVMLFSPVEYEYLFENFINHGHPIQHVKLIVCWDDRDDARLNRGSVDYMPKYKVGHYDVPILVIRRIPNVWVQNSKETK